MSELGDPPESKVSAQSTVKCHFQGHTPTSRWLAIASRIQHTTSKHAGIEDTKMQGYRIKGCKGYRMQEYTECLAAWWPL